MAYSSGPQGGYSFSTPRYRTFRAVTEFLSNGVTNPLDDHLAHEFNRIIGQQTLTVRNTTTGFTWSIELDGGSNALSNGYVGSFDPSANYVVMNPFNCLVTPIFVPPPTTVRLNRFQITTSAPDSKVYILEYSPFPNVLPLITLVAPSTLTTQSLELVTTYSRFLLG